MWGSNGLGKAALYPVRSRSEIILIGKNRYLVTPAVVSPRRNNRSRAQKPIFTIEYRHFWVPTAPEASWPPDVSAERLEARIPQPGVLSQASSARSPQPGVLSKIAQPGFLRQESPARSPQSGSSQPDILSQDWVVPGAVSATQCSCQQRN